MEKKLRDELKVELKRELKGELLECFAKFFNGFLGAIAICCIVYILLVTLFKGWLVCLVLIGVVMAKNWIDSKNNE